MDATQVGSKMSYRPKSTLSLGCANNAKMRSSRRKNTMRVEPTKFPNNALLTCWAWNHMLQTKHRACAPRFLDEHENASNAWRRKWMKVSKRGTRGFVLHQLFLENWVSLMFRRSCERFGK